MQVSPRRLIAVQAQEDVAKAVMLSAGMACAVLYLCTIERLTLSNSWSLTSESALRRRLCEEARISTKSTRRPRRRIWDLKRSAVQEENQRLRRTSQGSTPGDGPMIVWYCTIATKGTIPYSSLPGQSDASILLCSICRSMRPSALASPTPIPVLS